MVLKRRCFKLRVGDIIKYRIKHVHDLVSNIRETGGASGSFWFKKQLENSTIFMFMYCTL